MSPASPHDPPAGPPDLRRLYYVVRDNAPFRRLYAANAISQIGDWLSVVALYSLLFELTGRGEVVALVLITHLVPAFVFGPGAGVLADRISRRAMMVTADLLRAALVLCLLFVRSKEQVGFAYAVMTLHAIASAFFEPAQQATFPNLVPAKDLALASTLENSLWSVTLAIGSAAAGVLIALVGRDLAFGLDALSFLGSAWLLRGLPDSVAYARKDAAGAVEKTSDRDAAEVRESNLLPSGMALANLLGLADLRAGLRYVTGEARVLAILIAKSGFGLTLGGVLVLLAIFGERVFIDPSHAGRGLALLYTARGLGSFVGPLIAFRIAGDAPATLRRGITAALLLILSAYLAFSVSPSIWLAGLALAAGNAGGSILWTYGSALLQQIVPDSVRGRVAATEMAGMTLAMTISACTVGALVDRGIAPRILMAGCGLIALVPIAFWIAARERFTPPVHSSSIGPESDRA
jgi:MFS family permease